MSESEPDECVSSAASLAAAREQEHVADQPRASSHCLRCRYDLSATPDDAPCPECGLSAAARRSHLSRAYVRNLQMGAWLVFLGMATGLGVALWHWIVPETFLDSIDGIGWADRIVPRRAMALSAIEMAAAGCVLVGLWRLFAPIPASPTTPIAASPLLPNRLRRVSRGLIVALGVSLSTLMLRALMGWFFPDQWWAVFEWMYSDMGSVVMQSEAWITFAFRSFVWIAAGVLAIRLARRLGDERLELWLLVAIWAVPVVGLGGPILISGAMSWIGVSLVDLLIAAPVLISDAAIGTLAFLLHRKLLAVRTELDHVAASEP